MTKISTIALLSALALALAAPVANAEPAFFARAPIHEWHGQRFNVIRIDQMERFDGLRAMLENWTSSFPDEVVALQNAIRQNGPLARALGARGVQIVNVVAIQQGFNGNLIFYLR